MPISISPTTGTGTQELTLTPTANTSRSSITKTYRLKRNDEYVGNQLVVSQAAVGLAISITGSSSASAVQGETNIIFTGKANGKYIWFGASDNYSSIVLQEDSSGHMQNVSGVRSTSQVANFGNEYNFKLTLSVPSNMSTGSKTLTVYTSDFSTQQTPDDKQSVSYTLTVTEATATLTAISLPSSLNLGVNRGYQLSFTRTPSNGAVTSQVWDSSDTSVVSINTSTGYITGVSEGSATIGVVVNGTLTDSCDVSVYEEGVISASNITVNGSLTSGAADISYSNIRVNTIAVSGLPSWISSYSLNPSNNPTQILFTLVPNGSNNSRTETLTISGTDYLGYNRSSTFTVTQSVAYCSAMEITGSSTINNSGNSSNYTVSYSPVNTTQTSCTWTLTNEYAGDSNVYAEITNASNSGCTVVVKSGAVNKTVKLKATNTANQGIFYSKDIVVNYNIPGTITVSSNSVNVAATATSDNTVIIEVANVVPNSLSVYSYTGFISSATIQESGSVTRLVVAFPQNTSYQSRSGSVTLNAISADEINVISTTIQFTQAAAEAPAKSITVDSFTIAIPRPGKIGYSFSVKYNNSGSAQTTFITPTYSILGYVNGAQSVSHSGTLGNVVVAGHSNTTVNYSYLDDSSLQFTEATCDSYTIQIHSEDIYSPLKNGTIDL